MNNKPLFTIALLGYQTEPYLPQALDSIANQTFRNFDVMCIVEESTDNSLLICREWAKCHSDCEVISLPKSGSGACCRNYAIDHAKGQYLVFIDGDDWIRIDMLDRLSDKLHRTGELDILAFAAVETRTDTANFESKESISNFLAEDANDVFPGLDAIRRTARHKGTFLGYTCINAFSVEFLRKHKLYQKPGFFMEDYEQVSRAWFFADRLSYLDEILYAYRRRPGSATTTTKLFFDSLEIFRSLLDFAYSQQVPVDIMSIWSNQCLSFIYWMMFHPVTSHNMPPNDMQKAVDIISNGKGWSLIKRLSRHASLPKRVALPFIRLAAYGWVWPARFFFEKCYYPLVERRHRQK